MVGVGEEERGSSVVLCVGNLDPARSQQQKRLSTTTVTPFSPHQHYAPLQNTKLAEAEVN